MSYKFLKDPFTGENLTDVIQRKSDEAVIPFDSLNKDYKDYIEWAKTNTPEEAD